MKKKEKRMIAILIIITIIVFIIKIRLDRTENNSAEEQTAPQAEYVQEEKGTKQSTSNKLQETKKFGEFEMSNIQITEQNGLATLTASVKNTSSQTKNEFPFTIKLLNDKGEVLQNLKALLGKTEAGETRGINASINMDISQIYDISVEF